MSKRKSSRQKKPRGKTFLLTVPPYLETWLIERTQKQGASSVQESVRQILTAARRSEQKEQTV